MPAERQGAVYKSIVVDKPFSVVTKEGLQEPPRGTSSGT
jgi:hypothetical protein